MLAKLAQLIATGGGVGYAPVASGTVASAVVAALWWVLPLSVPVQWVVCAAMTLGGVWASGVVARRLGDQDPSVVVIDEFAGMWLAVAGLPKAWPVIGAAFLLFRILDIGKFPPMKQLEHLPGGWGIMLDDVAAGAITRLCLLGLVAYMF
ncbi:MAG: phosphatidylglycerophosphatase A [Candidatus Omnitrophica bacterium]|nr:phosphatidylglycerophosphatase A [Candidatus Omnitrophota bacterium]